MVAPALGSDAVTSLPPAAATAVAWRARGALHVTVIAKATFAFAPEAEMAPAEPQPILRSEVHHGDHPGKSVRFTSDLAPYLGRADVLFTGAAYAPPPGPVEAMPVRLAVFDGQRAILDKTLRAQDPSGLSRMPIVYERAVGGLGSVDNPLGVAADGGEPGILDPRDPRRPAGFAPIARAFPARKRLLGSTPRRDLDGAIALIPDGFDWSYFQAAPADQRVDFLRGDEWIVLEGLHPSLARLRTRLPGARGRARVYGLSSFGVSEGQPLELAADTLRIDGDEQRCTVVWRKSFPVASEAALAAVRVVAGVELPGAPIVWPDRLDPRAGEGSAALPEGEGARPALIETLAIPEDAAAACEPVLPFQPAPLALPPAIRAPIAVPVAVPAPVPAPAPEARVEGPGADSAPRQAPVAERAEPSAVVDLLWFDPRSLPRVRKHPAWRPILDALRDEPLDTDIDDPSLDVDPAAAEDRREIFEVLVHAEPSAEAALRAALKDAVRDDGRFVAPLVLLAGELCFGFDEIEALAALVAVVAPLPGSDDRLKAALAAAQDFLRAQGPLSPPGLADALAAGIKDAYGRGKRALPLADVEAQADRALLEQRRYQRRAVFGGRHLRALVRIAGAAAPIPTYLPEALAEALPMFQRFSARLVAEAHLAVDQREAHPVALRAVAAARVASPAHRW